MAENNVPLCIGQIVNPLEISLYDETIYANLKIKLSFDRVMEEYYISIRYTKKDGFVREISLTMEEGKILLTQLPNLISLYSRCNGVWSKTADKEKIMYSSENVRYTLLSFMGQLYVDIRKLFRKQYGEYIPSKIGVRLPLGHMIGLHDHLEECITTGETDAKESLQRTLGLIGRRVRAILEDRRGRVDFEKAVDTLEKPLIGEDGEHGEINRFFELWSQICDGSRDDLYECVIGLNQF